MTDSSMRAWHWDDYGTVDGLVLHEHPVPEPGPGEVLVRIHASSLNFRDLVVMANAYPTGKLPAGRIPLGDCAGEVVKNGRGCGLFAVGDRVSDIAVHQWLNGDRYPRRTDLPQSQDGKLADYIVLPEAVLVRVPDHLSWTEAASLACAGSTAWSAVFSGSGILPGQTVLTQGTGGVSLFALQFAKMAGARVIATSSRPEKLERLRALGADVAIDYAANPDWDRLVLEATAGRGADVIVEVGGSGTLERSMRCVRLDGRISVVGMRSTGLAAPVAIDPTPMRQRRIRMQPIWCASREAIEDMHDAIAVNRMRPVIDAAFPFSEARAAFRLLEEGRQFGKIVIDHDA